MDAVRLQVVCNDEVLASITCDGSDGGHADYYSIVYVKGFIEHKKIYGIDPVQSFVLGWRLIEDLTYDKRLSAESTDEVNRTSWRIENF
ncbi:MAG: hypothetical protein ABIR04_05020 [Cypionkella sp.]